MTVTGQRNTAFQAAKPSRLAYYWLLAALLLATPGCTLLATGLWVMNPNDVEAQFDGLAKRRVAVVCHSGGSEGYQSIGVNKELALKVSRQLSENVPKIELVSQSKIDDWLDQNELESPTELGAAVGAEVVVLIDLMDFRLYKGTSVLQGQASAEITIYDVASGQVLSEVEPIESAYPPGNGIPIEISEQSAENRFRRRFLYVLAHQIARRFYDHDSRAATKVDRFYQES